MRKSAQSKLKKNLNEFTEIRLWMDLLAVDRKARATGHALLTEHGLRYVQEQLLLARRVYAKKKKHQPRVHVNGQAVSWPYWNAEQRALWLGDVLIKEFTQPAPNQVAILEAFESSGWKRKRVNNPLSSLVNGDDDDATKRLCDTIKNLNRGLRSGTIRFRMDSEGKHVMWLLVHTPFHFENHDSLDTK